MADYPGFDTTQLQAFIITDAVTLANTNHTNPTPPWTPASVTSAYSICYKAFPLQVITVASFQRKCLTTMPIWHYLVTSATNHYYLSIPDSQQGIPFALISKAPFHWRSLPTNLALSPWSVNMCTDHILWPQSNQHKKYVNSQCYPYTWLPYWHSTYFAISMHDILNNKCFSITYYSLFFYSQKQTFIMTIVFLFSN